MDNIAKVARWEGGGEGESRNIKKRRETSLALSDASFSGFGSFRRTRQQPITWTLTKYADHRSAYIYIYEAENKNNGFQMQFLMCTIRSIRHVDKSSTSKSGSANNTQITDTFHWDKNRTSMNWYVFIFAKQHAIILRYIEKRFALRIWWQIYR